MRVLDLNADAGESFGRWALGSDEALATYVTSFNVACGFHAGDPTTMRGLVCLAREHGIGLGAHPGLPDLLGFGRRMMDVRLEDLLNYWVYQLGALRALAALEGTRVEHVKPHGAIYTMIWRNPTLAAEIARAVATVDPSIVLVLVDGPPAEAAEAAGGLVAREAYVDIDYDDDGQLIIEAVKQARDPAEMAERAAQVAHGRIRTISGKRLEVHADTICVHGDGPNAVAIAEAVRSRLEKEGTKIGRLREAIGARE